MTTFVAALLRDAVTAALVVDQPTTGAMFLASTQRGRVRCRDVQKGGGLPASPLIRFCSQPFDTAQHAAGFCSVDVYESSAPIFERVH